MDYDYQSPEIKSSRNDDYMQTGNTIPIQKEELVSYIKQLLVEFDASPNNDASPYVKPIIYQTEDKRLIEIPKELHDEVVQEHLNDKHNQHNEHNNQINYVRNNRTERLATQRTDNILPIIRPKIDDSDDMTSAYIVIILIIISVIYFYLNKSLYFN